VPAGDVIKALMLVIHNGAMVEGSKQTLTFQQQLNRLRALGMGDAEIRQLLLNDFVDANPVYFGAYRSAIKEQIAGGIHQAYETAAVDAYRESGVTGDFRWTTVGDNKSCADCAERAGEIRPLDEWELIGLPKSGFSRCGERCRCEITPVAFDAPDRIVTKKEVPKKSILDDDPEDPKSLIRAGQEFGTDKKRNIEIAIRAWQAKGVNARVVSSKDPKHVRAGLKRKGGAFYWTNPDTGAEEIVVNPYSATWKDPAGMARKHGPNGTGFYSSDDPGRILVHEYGHYAYRDASPSVEHLFINDHILRDLVREEVGQYAATNVREFIAEVFTGLNNGRQYSPRILDTYKRFKAIRTRA